MPVDTFAVLGGTQVEGGPARAGPAAEARSPFEAEGLSRRVAPFAAVMLVAVASLAVPAWPKSLGDTLAAVGLLGATSAMLVLPWSRIPPGFSVLVPLTCLASVLMITLAAGGSSSVSGIVALVPLTWAALYHRRWQSALVVVGVVVVECVTSLTPVAQPGATVVQRTLLWGLLGTLLCLVAQDLRGRARGQSRAREELLRQTVALEAAAKELAATLGPDDVIEKMPRLAAELVSPGGTAAHAAHYSRLDEHAPVLPSGYDAERQCIFVPVVVGGKADGVLSVPVAGITVTEELLGRCTALGHLAELALANGLALHAAREQAAKDPLTSLPNRSGFEEFIAHRPGRRSFVILALDIDGLGQVNETLGYKAGDELIAHVAEMVGRTMRRGDVLARMGGDEFAAYLFDATEADGCRVAERMLEALVSPLPGAMASVSIGVAMGAPNDDAHIVHEAASAAMHRAKRAGGRGYEVGGSLLVPPGTPSGEELPARMPLKRRLSHILPQVPDQQ